MTTYYKRIGSPDIYAVQYDNGNIIKSVELETTWNIIDDNKFTVDNPYDHPYKYASIDIREIDTKGKFNDCKLRTYPIQIM